MPPQTAAGKAVTVLRRAKPSEAEALTTLAIAAKSHWGYSPEFMAAARAELTITPDDISSRPVIVAEQTTKTTTTTGGEGGGSPSLAAVYSIAGDPPRAELSFLWVQPQKMGMGLGRLLWRDALRRAAEMGYEVMLVDADPNAEGFYARMGADKVGESESGSVPGRMLPLMRAVVPSLEELRREE
ncbi:hypothetical protein K4F52_004168 [Lecanicillium sp. MT-2017a]|nr:hypothetical protein K4F52_004168 [Lecanicillium sp. MT-2017a]